MARASTHSQAIRAMVDAPRGDADSARRRLADEAGRSEAADMGLYAAAARRRLGAATGGAEGREVIVRPDSSMAGRGVRNPERITNMPMPGFPG